MCVEKLGVLVIDDGGIRTRWGRMSMKRFGKNLHSSSHFSLFFLPTCEKKGSLGILFRSCFPLFSFVLLRIFFLPLSLSDEFPV
jgi:hypothetical protein